ncbi:MAG: nucleotidyltransferase domain-containing protein [Gammaproteobacteria bacterium]|nr:MAG: nucleotidyltransferase domain-containing protein [Gammaproteobacteria bacterium]
MKRLDPKHPHYEALRRLKAELAALYGSKLAKVILYGSYARGDYHADSDMDILVVLKKPAISLARELERIARLAVRFDLQNATWASLLPLPEERLQDPDTTFLKNVLAEGREIW